MNYYNVIQEWAAKPVVRYVAGGLAAAALTRIAMNLNEKYPEISSFLKENLDIFEEKLGEFRSSYLASSEQGEEARH